MIPVSFVKYFLEEKPMELQQQFLVGLGGWEHEEFDRCLYPRQKAGSHEKLEYYSQIFDTVEVRPTFWDDSLSATDATEWRKAVSNNKRFLFNVKLHSSFTHKKGMDRETARRVRGILQELAKHDHLGTLLLQFAYSFTNTSENRFHLVRLSELFRGFPAHVEVRHESWGAPGYLSMLEENQLGVVNADLPRVGRFLPHIPRVVGDSAYIRLHGRNEKGWLLNGMDTRYDYLYNTREIQEILRRVRINTAACEKVMILCNNTTGGKGVVNALQIVSALRSGKPVLIPEAALKAFPDLTTLHAVVEPCHPLLEEFREAM